MSQTSTTLGYLMNFTCFLNSCTSSGVMVSALAMTGIMLTLSQSLCINSTSSVFSPCPDGAMKYRQVWTRLSVIALRWTRDSAVRYSSYLDSTNSMTGTQLKLRILFSIKKPHCYNKITPHSPVAIIYSVTETRRIDHRQR